MRDYRIPKNLLTGSTAKMLKSRKKGWKSYILHLAPINLAVSAKTVCPKADAACVAICLNTAGRGQLTVVQQARANKTRYFWADRAGFVAQLKTELDKLERRAVRRKENISVRLNGTSDLAWFSWIDFGQYLHLRFYDYTKVIGFLGQSGNYHQTFSRTASNWEECERALSMGYNVAACFERLPKEYRGYRVIDGDSHDLRFLDRKNVIVGLK